MKIDSLVRRVVQNIGRQAIYERGWGDLVTLSAVKQVVNAWTEPSTVGASPSIDRSVPMKAIDGARCVDSVVRPSSCSRRMNVRLGASNWKQGILDWRPVRGTSRHEFETSFVSPLHGILPDASRVARARVVLPRSGPVNSVAVLLPPTGSHSYLLRQRLLAQPLSQRGVASLLLMLPFFGDRRPSTQRSRSGLAHVSDLFTMGVATTAELDVLLASLHHWLRPEAVTLMGVSVGGYMASASAAMLQSTRRDLGLVTVCSPKSAVSVYCDGVLADSVRFDVLGQQDPAPLFRALQLDPTTCDPPIGDQMAPGPERGRSMLRAVLSHMTSLDQFPAFQGPASIILAKHDEYISAQTDQTGVLCEKWPRASLENIDASHCTVLLFRKYLVNAVLQQLQRLQGLK